MKPIILILLISIIGFPALSQSEGIDTLVYRNSNKRGVYVIKHDQSTVEYKTSVEAKEISIISFYKLDFLILRNGDTIKTNSREAYIDDYNVFKKAMVNKEKRIGQLNICTNLGTIYQFAPFKNHVANLGLNYYFNSFLSISAYGYIPLNSNDLANFKNGFELNLGLSSSRNGNFDWGAKVGLIVSSFDFTLSTYDNFITYKEDPSGNLEHNGINYSYEGENIENEKTTRPVASMVSPLIALEFSYQSKSRLGLSLMFGLRSKFSKYVAEGVRYRSNEYYRYLNTNNEVVDEVESFNYYNYQPNYETYRDPQLFGRLILKYRLAIKQNKPF